MAQNVRVKTERFRVRFGPFYCCRWYFVGPVPGQFWTHILPSHGHGRAPKKVMLKYARTELELLPLKSAIGASSLATS